MKKTYLVGYWSALSATLVACSGDGQFGVEPTEGQFGTLEQSVTLMDKPGTEAAEFTEAGQDIEQVGAYTVYSANSDAHTAQGYEGSVQLFKNDLPFASYQARTPVEYNRIGFQVAMSENWIVTDVAGYPLAPGQIENVLLVVGKTNGEFNTCGAIGADGSLPNCVTCTGNPADWLTAVSCTANAGVEIVEAPPGFESINPTFELEGNELLVAKRYGGEQIAQLKHDGSSWVLAGRLPAPIPGEQIGGSMAISGNRLAVSAQGQGNSYVYVYERANYNASWQLALRIDSPNPSVSGFGGRVDLSGNYLVATDVQDLHFIELSASALADPSTAIAGGCTASTQTQLPDVAISGNRVVLAGSQRLPITFERTDQWKFYGGLPAGLFPDDVNPDGSSTLQSLWGAAIDADRAAIGWRNYRGDNAATVTGAALGFSFDAYDCGKQMGVPGAGWVRARQLSIPGVNAPNISGYPESNAIDGSTSTRWMATATSGTRFELDLGELELLSHLEIAWGNVYASDYLVEISSDPDSVPASQRTWTWLTHVTNGDGATDYVVVRNDPDAFGRRVRVTMNLFAGSGDTGVSIREFEALGMASATCSAKPPISCANPATATAPPHVCANDCGGQAEGLSCFCDSSCVSFGDCCSPDGSDMGAQYFDDILAICPDIGN